MPSKSRSKTITRDPNWLGPAIVPGEILLEEFLIGDGRVFVALAQRAMHDPVANFSTRGGQTTSRELVRG
jgi:hypothetical protein